ncbi:putative F-box/LRR-repeat protein At3g42770 [Lolium rigidum]|uniref:putative F-box/LRR-repeat protein At3g42770 n=1 Tax=Lolium rigidum TaxID=89674 RepID=UPI001F5D907D|nr:putative F-box/LRR-repeat protein At3g42770 [Lolium rigidum]XP_047079791.1 putative F-box/LRR-repeat protein At3g42770 [Lolium rigidum]
MNPADEDAMEFIRLDSKDFEGLTAKKFARMVNDRLLVRSNVDLHTFQLHWDEFPGIHVRGMRRWMKYAVNHNVKVLDVILDDYDKTHLPPCIFTCHSLQELNLQWGAPGNDLEHIGRVIPDEIYLPSLKKLTLRDVEFEQSSLNKFIAHSPYLEDIHLIDSLCYLNLIESKVLKKLTIDGSIDIPPCFTISAPHLISFECMRYELKNISWRDQPTLESAQIDARGTTFDGGCKFTEILVHAKKLALFGLDIKVMLEKELPTCSVFQSLVTLEIGKWYLTEDLFVVLRFLQLSPRLEKLKLIQKSAGEGAETKNRPVDGMTFQCPLLESVTIQCSEGDEGIDKLGNVLVANGVSLDKISVTILVTNKYRKDEIHVTLYEYIKKRALQEKISASEGQVKKARR